MKWTELSTRVALVISGVALTINPAHADDGQILLDLSDPTLCPGLSTHVCRITQPGSYFLEGGLTVPAGAHGIEIISNDVTLDLNGWTIDGAAQDAIRIGGSRVTVRGGFIRDAVNGVTVFSDQVQLQDLVIADSSEFGIKTVGMPGGPQLPEPPEFLPMVIELEDLAIYNAGAACAKLERITAARVDNVLFSDCIEAGLRTEFSENIQVTDSVFAWSKHGIDLFQTREILLEDLLSVRHWRSGITVDANPDKDFRFVNARIHSINVSHNSIGLRLGGFASSFDLFVLGAEVSDVLASRNSAAGVGVSNFDGAILHHIVAPENGTFGLQLEAMSQNTIFSHLFTFDTPFGDFSSGRFIDGGFHAHLP